MTVTALGFLAVSQTINVATSPRYSRYSCKIKAGMSHRHEREILEGHEEEKVTTSRQISELIQLVYNYCYDKVTCKDYLRVQF